MAPPGVATGWQRAGRPRRIKTIQQFVIAVRQHVRRCAKERCMSSVFFRSRPAGVPLCLLFLSLSLAVFAQSDDAESLRPGKILVASPDYVDRIYGQSVILVTHYGPNGAAGIMLNRQTPLSSSEAL